MYIQFTKDINKIKSTVIFNLGVREIIIALIIIGISLIEYLFTRKFLPSDFAFYPLVPTILLGMFFMVYKKNEMRFGKVMFYKIKRVLFSRVKRYETETKEADNSYGTD